MFYLCSYITYTSYSIAYYQFYRLIGLVDTMFANGPGDLGSIQDFKNGTWYLLA